MKHVRAVLLLPFMVTVVIPALLIRFTSAANIGWGLAVPLSALPMLVGVLLIAAGLWLVMQTVRLFAKVGQGTLAPWDATRKLVVVGVYRYTRNPMISGVMSILLGEAAFLGSAALLAWFAGFAIVNLLYIPLAEEPGLVARFGEEYLRYRENVPRWIPRRRAWQPPDKR